MRNFSYFAGAALAATAVAQNTQTSTQDVAAAAATAKTSSPTSHVHGAAFDRIAIVWLENTDYSKAVGDPNLAALAKKGITLSNYFGVTHPSEPNYVAGHGGDNFGMDNDDFNSVDANISSIVDLLEAKGVSWGAYQEDQPYSGFEGFSWVNQKTKANDYVRKHNPPVIYGANNSPQRLSQIKNLTTFFSDLEANTLPQWMFITPNMTSDGHDSSVTTAGSWCSNFLTPLLNNKKFMKRTLVLLTFDENHTYTDANRVLAILLGDAVPPELVGTTDDSFYDHYSELSTVEANWGLDTLGRWDVGANVFSFVAKATGDVIAPWDGPTAEAPTVFLNESFPGVFSTDTDTAGYPAPNISMVHNGRKVADSIVQAWQGSDAQTYYQDTVEIPDGLRPPVYGDNVAPAPGRPAHGRPAPKPSGHGYKA